jgi:hypothetical protein
MNEEAAGSGNTASVRSQTDIYTSDVSDITRRGKTWQYGALNVNRYNDNIPQSHADYSQIDHHNRELHVAKKLQQ